MTEAEAADELLQSNFALLDEVFETGQKLEQQRMILDLFAAGRRSAGNG